jgi:hypothetical protein
LRELESLSPITLEKRIQADDPPVTQDVLFAAQARAARRSGH